MTAPESEAAKPHLGLTGVLTKTRLDALRLVANGDLEYATTTGVFEPMSAYRSPAFAWLDEHGLIAVDYDAEPVGRVLRLVPVYITDEGRAVLAMSDYPAYSHDAPKLPMHDPRPGDPPTNVNYLEIMGVPIRPPAEDAEGRLWRAEERIERLEQALDGVASILAEHGLWTPDA